MLVPIQHGGRKVTETCYIALELRNIEINTSPRARTV